MSEIDQYDYELPRELIAQHPLAHRSDSRLLVVDRGSGSLEHAHVRDLPELLDPRDALVINDTKVIPARLVGYRTRTGGRWHGLFLTSTEQGIWKVLGKTRGKLTPGETVTLEDNQSRDYAQLRMLADLGGGQWAAKPESDEQPLQLLERVGRVPLPNYIRDGEMVESDRANYQTVFAEKPGAVAAPTAGLHFTAGLLRQIEKRGLALCRVTLHVGPGTFRPLATPHLSEHQMHAEWGCISGETVEVLDTRRRQGGRIVAVGSTSARVLETAARGGKLKPWQGETNLFIRPPFVFHATNALMTNFHLPRTTLLVLVRTFGGEPLMRRAYDEAIREEYRFFSYGDAMLVL